MNVKFIGEVVTKFKPYVMIINQSGQILYNSKKIESLIKSKIGSNENIQSIFNIEVEDILVNHHLKIKVGTERFNLTKVLLENQKELILILDLIGNYNNYATRAFCLEKVIENLNDGILLTDKQGKVVIYNHAMEELEKKNSKDMIGKYIWDAYEYHDFNASEHMQVFYSGVPILNKYKAHAYNKGEPVYKSYSTFPIEQDEDIIGVYSISKNETKLQSLLAEIIELKRQFKGSSKDKKTLNGTRFYFSDIIGSSEIMKKLIKESQTISWLDNNVLIVGDTGTGKEVFAQSIHNYGKRKPKPFIGINCSAIPENLLESILFGTVKGAYTGAVDSTGLFEEAKDGTLFLDELNSMPVSMQTKLLRVLQEKSVRRVGGKNVYPIQCRVISAMNEDPLILIEKGKLRKDLFYRIAGYTLYIPPLKDRGHDIFELADYFISKNNLTMNKNITEITDELKEMMKRYTWPGNIRELEHFVENIMVKTNDDDHYLRVSNIPNYILDAMQTSNQYNNDFIFCKTLQEKLNDMEKKLILQALDANKWNVTKSAKSLGITRQSLIYRMRKFNIKQD